MAFRLVSPDLQFVASMAVMRVPFTQICIKPSMIVDMVVALMIPPRSAVFFIALLLMGRDRRWALFLVFVAASVVIYGDMARRLWAMVIGAIMAVMTMIFVMAFRSIHRYRCTDPGKKNIVHDLDCVYGAVSHVLKEWVDVIQRY